MSIVVAVVAVAAAAVITEIMVTVLVVVKQFTEQTEGKNDQNINIFTIQSSSEHSLTANTAVITTIFVLGYIFMN